MANTYSVVVNNLCTVSGDALHYVVAVSFTVTGSDGTNTASIQGFQDFTIAEDKTDFVPYSRLTENDVIGWINSATDNLLNFYPSIDEQLSYITNPPNIPQITPLPWATT